MDIAAATAVDPSIRGNPACWFDLFDYDFCCDIRHGPSGNADCWDGYYSFSYCCQAPLQSVTSPDCWAEARANLDASDDPIAQHPILQDPSNLAVFCCHASVSSSASCWGAGRPGGADVLIDHSNGEALNFTRRHVECCFPELQRLVREEPPTWMARQLHHDVLRWEHTTPLTAADLDAFEARAEAAGCGAKFCRFRVRQRNGGQIFHCDFGRSRYYPLLHALRAALHILQILAGLPDMDFLVHTDEYFGVGSDNPGDLEVTVPVLVQGQPQGCPGVLMPWWAFLQLDWTRRYRDRLQEASAKRPWAERRATLFWRGSDTGCLLPGAGCSGGGGINGCGCDCADWTRDNWPLFPRSRLVLASSLAPSRVDAYYTKDTVHRDCQDTYDASGLRVGEIVPPEAHVRYKYLMYIDGNSFSDRLYWLLLTDSLVFRAESQIRVWLDGGLKAWEHYVPVAENLTDLMDRLDWARANDEGSERIAAEAARFAESHLSLEGSLLYLYHLLLRLSSVVHLTPDEVEVEGPWQSREVPSKGDAPTASAEPVEPAEAAASHGGLDCWALGYTPDFCCNVDQFGPLGNVACWDGPYTFESCCTGRFSSKEYWKAWDPASSTS